MNRSFEDFGEIDTAVQRSAVRLSLHHEFGASAEREGVLVVSNAALRFRVPAQKESSGAFSLLPVPPDLGRSEAPTAGDAVYVLRAGALARVVVDAGLSDGRWTEVSAPGLNEGEAVVVGLLEAS